MALPGDWPTAPPLWATETPNLEGGREGGNRERKLGGTSNNGHSEETLNNGQIARPHYSQVPLYLSLWCGT